MKNQTLTKLANQIIALRQGRQGGALSLAPNETLLIEKIGARHTRDEGTLIQKIHDLTLDLGGECHPLTRRAGARHSRGDQMMVQRIHDDCSGLGAVCKALPEKDKIYSSQVLKENPVTKAQSDAPNYQPASTPQRCANCRFFLGDPGRDWCTLFDFTADPDYVSDAWEPQRPDEIPGYVAAKGEQMLTEKNWENSTVAQRQARDAINNAIKAGTLKKASTKTCYRCRKRPGAEYHHINGYSKDRRLQVRAVCNRCHTLMTNKADLAALTEGILMLRGGRTSGNWGHAGRKGKRGGSGRGGGFGRIGIKRKPGAKLSRKKVKAAAKKQAKSAKPTAKPKVTEKKPVAAKKATKKPQAKPKGKVSELNDIFDKAPKGSQAAFNKHLLDKMSTGAISLQEAQELNTRFAKAKPKAAAKKPTAKKKIVKPEPKKAEPKDKPKLAAAKSDLAKAKNERDRELKGVLALEKQKVTLNKKLRQKQDVLNTLNKLDEVDQQLKGRSSKKILENYNKDTRTASDIVFNANLAEAKVARTKIENRLSEGTKKKKAAERKLKSSRKGVAKNDKEFRKAKNEFGDNDPRTIKAKKSLEKAKKSADTAKKEVEQATIVNRDEMLNILSVSNPSSTNVSLDKSKISATTRKEWDKTMKDFNRLVSDDVTVPDHTVEFSVTSRKRASATPPGDRINISKNTRSRTIAHEVAHTIEMKNPRIQERAIAWRDRRTKGEKEILLSEATGNLNYREEEKTKPDGFFSPYIGKSYKSGATEVVSMGIERMFNDPAGFAKEDPDMFDFIYAVTRSG